MGAALALQASDNIQLEPTHPKSDLVIRPELHAMMICPVSDNNVLNLNLQSGYSAYLEHPEFNRFYIGPESELDFQIYAGDFHINLHDRCSLLENNYEDPTVVGSADYTRLENALGARVLWDLNKALLTLGYEHINYISFNSPASAAFPDANSEVLSSSAGYRLKPGLLVGLETGATLFRYASSANSQFTDALQCTIGPFVDVQLTEYVTCRAGAGYSAYSTLGENNAALLADDYGLYAHIDLVHQLNRFVDYALSGGKNITFALYGGTVDLSYARLRANWHLVRKFAIATSLSYEHGTVVTPGGETFDRFGPAISLDRLLTPRMTAGLEYQFYERDSNLPGRSYTNNIFIARLVYDF
jgi:hypothetical protein